MDFFKVSGLFNAMIFVFLIVGVVYYEYMFVLLTLSTICLIAGFLFYFIMRFDDIDDTLYEIKKSLKDKRRIV